MGCSARGPRSAPETSRTWRLSTTSCSAPPTGGGSPQADVPYDISALQDLNKFPAVIDRLQQGVLNTLLLGRLMANPNGFASDAAFQQSGNPLFDTSHLYYDGNSQGGIMGGITTAVAPDYTRAVLGVTGMDYGGILLQRSTDFTHFAIFLYGQAPGGGYTDASIHPLMLDLMQQLWDRGEADGYAAHMTSDPLPGTPAHKVLMQTAYGDHQVSQYAAAVEARTIGAQAHQPALDLPARCSGRQPVLRDPGDPELPVRRLGVGDLGRRPRPRTTSAAHEHAADGGARPAQRRARDGGGADPEVGLPGRERQRGGRLWRPAVPHRRLHAVRTESGGQGATRVRTRARE